MWINDGGGENYTWRADVNPPVLSDIARVNRAHTIRAIFSPIGEEWQRISRGDHSGEVFLGKCSGAEIARESHESARNEAKALYFHNTALRFFNKGAPHGLATCNWLTTFTISQPVARYG